MKTSTDTMLRELGYSTTATGISAFQRDYNRIGTKPVRVTGELDAATRSALELAHSTAAMFKTLRDAGQGTR